MTTPRSATPQRPLADVLDDITHVDVYNTPNWVLGKIKEAVAELRRSAVTGVSRETVIEECLEAVRGEYLEDPNKSDAGDRAYDMAVGHCIEALKRLLVSARATSFPGVKIAKMFKDQRDAAADVLRRLMAKMREESGAPDDPMAPFAYDASWEALAKEADAILDKCPSYEQQLRNIAEGVGMSYEELIAAVEGMGGA